MNDCEKLIISTWLEKILHVDFMGRDILRAQLSLASVSIHQCFEHISVKFQVEDALLFTHNVRVPVQMVAWQENGVPIVFLLHVINGFIDELEVVMMDASKINVHDVDLSKVEYDVNKLVSFS